MREISGHTLALSNNSQSHSTVTYTLSSPTHSLILGQVSHQSPGRLQTAPSRHRRFLPDFFVDGSRRNSWHQAISRISRHSRSYKTQERGEWRGQRSRKCRHEKHGDMGQCSTYLYSYESYLGRLCSLHRSTSTLPRTVVVVGRKESNRIFLSSVRMYPSPSSQP